MIEVNRIADLQKAIDRVVTIKARLYGLVFQAAACDGAALLLPGPNNERRELGRLRLYRPVAPTLEAVTDAVIEMLARIHERFGPGRVWTLGHIGASERIAIMEDEGGVRTDGRGNIMLRMYYVHEHSTLGPYDADPESKWPWGEVPRQYLGKPTPKPTGVSSTYGAPQAATTPAPHDPSRPNFAPMTLEQAKQAGGWEREIDGAWRPCDERGDQPDGKRWPPPNALGGIRYKAVIPGAGTVTVKTDPALSPGVMRIEESHDGKTWTGPIAVGDYVRWDPDGGHRDDARTLDGTVTGVYEGRVIGLRLGAINGAWGPAWVNLVIGREFDPSVSPGTIRRIDRPVKLVFSRYSVPFTITREQLVAETKYDGLTGAECLRRYTENQHEHGSRLLGRLEYTLTAAQLGAARELWSLQLKAKVSASKDRDRQRVVLDQEVD